MMKTVPGNRPLSGALTTTVRRVMEEGGLHALFQPIVHLRKCEILGHEALIRGPEGSALHLPMALLDAAARENLSIGFELQCVEVALTEWGRLGRAGAIFVNMSADAFVHCTSDSVPCFLERILGHARVLPHTLVIELTERDSTSDGNALKRAVQTAHLMGIRLALDDFGDGHSNLRLWAELKPDFVKIDKFFTRSIASRSTNFEMVRAIRIVAEALGTELVAEGIETEADLRVLRDLDVSCGQGYFLGRPVRLPLDTPGRDARRVLMDGRIAVMPTPTPQARFGALRGFPIIAAPVIHPTTSNDEVATLFQRQTDLHAVAVVDAQRPIALLNRQVFLNEYARLYFREVHGRRPAIELANRSPRIVELDHDVEDLIGILTSEDQRYLNDGFVITDDGRYLGLGTGDRLVRAVTETRIEAARHANPLTFLPGNIPINLHVARLLEGTKGFVAAYVDLDNFKPFNDRYGYWRGDEVIRKVAEVLKTQVSAVRDFVGHVGGDDFIVLFQSEDWARRCREIMRVFASQALAFYDEAERSAGGLQARDRHGIERMFPFIGLSIGAVCVAGDRLARAAHRVEDVANAAAIAKHRAKASPSSMAVLSLADESGERPGYEPAAALDAARQ